MSLAVLLVLANGWMQTRPSFRSLSSGVVIVIEMGRDGGLVDSRPGRNRWFSLADLLRQTVYIRAACCEGMTDAARLSADPTFRLMGSERVRERGVALTSTRQWSKRTCGRGRRT